jgi:chromosome segregation ATPase
VSSSAIPIISTGFGWTPILLTFANLLIGGVFVAIIRTRPTLKKIANDREANLLSERAAEMEAMRARLARLEAERSIDRHRLNNITQCFDALVMLLETNPERASEAVAKVKAMRAEQMKAEAAEKGALHAADLRGGGE